MKSAREMAELLWEELPTGARALLDREAWVDGTETLFKVHARDQRHLCADWCAGIESTDGGHIVSACHAAAMNAPAPGEGT